MKWNEFPCFPLVEHNLRTGRMNMKHVSGDADKLKEKFWNKLADAPIVFLQLDRDAGSAIPMRAHLDEEANHAIWFFVARDNSLASGGPATASFASKDHEIFARFQGALTEESDVSRRHKHWGKDVESWFPGGRDSPMISMLRMDLGMAEIWDHDLGMMATVKSALGMDMREKGEAQHVNTAL